MNILTAIKNLWESLFKRNEILSSLGLPVDEPPYNPIMEFVAAWRRIYSGVEFEGFKDAKIAATVCHEAARLVCAEMEATTGESPRALYIQSLLDTHVLNKAAEITEYACALGGIILKPRFDGTKLVTDYITQDMFYPTQYDNTGIQGGIFIERRKRGKYIYTRLENWVYKGGSTYEVINRAYKSDLEADLGQPINLDVYQDWAVIVPNVIISGAPVPMFAIFKMPGANFVDTNNPIGVSLFAKSVDSIRAANTAYNALDWEIEGGELRRYRDESTLKYNKDGKVIPDSYIRQKEYIFNGAAGESGVSLFETFSPTLRVADQIAALNRHLNQIEAQTGFSQGTFSVDEATGAVTATQIVSEKQKTYSTVNSIQKAFETALRQLITIYDFYATVYNLAPKGEIEPSFYWDDSVISSPEEKRVRFQLLVSQGKFPLRRFLTEYEGYSEDEVNDIMTQLADENNAPTIDFGGA